MTKKERAAAAKTAERLERALADRLLVRVRRSIPDADVLDGFVVGIGRKWVALARLSDRVELDGWTLLRLSDVHSVKITPDPECFAIRALRLREQWPPPAVEVDLDDDAGAVEGAAGSRPMVAVRCEWDRSDVCWIGSVRSVKGSTLSLLEVGVEAEWASKARRFDLDDITRLDFGGGYEEALALVAGPAPER